MEQRPDVARLRPPVDVERGGAAGLGAGQQQLPARLRAVRPTDLVDVTFAFDGLAVERRGRRLVLVRAPRARRARLVLLLPPQSVAEVAYAETAPAGDVAPGDRQNRGGTAPENPVESLPPPGSPVLTLMSGPSQLVFDVGDAELDFTLAGLLEATRRLPLVVGRNAPTPKHLLLLDASAVRLTVDRARLRRATARLAASGPATVAVSGQALAQLRSNAIALEHRFGREAAASWVAGQLGVTVDPALVEQALHSKVASRPARPADPLPAGLTGIELPFRLLLSPHADAAFALRSAPPAAGAAAELWHARLGLRPGDPQDPVDEHPSPRRTVRAVWATDRDVRPLPDPGTSFPPDLPDALEKGGEPRSFRLSLNSNDRLSIVHQTSDFALKIQGRPWTPPAVPVDRLFLSTLGGWLDGGVSWSTQPDGFEVEDWRHLATLGRDHYVRIVRAGYLFPTGHRASFVKVTERRFHTDLRGNPAFLRQRYFIVVREPFRVFPSLGDAAEDRRNPLRDMRITTVVTPPLDPPVQLDVPGSGTGTVFQPTLDQQPFSFQAVATDAAGNLVEMSLPLLFVGKSAHDDDATVGALALRYDGSPGTATVDARTAGQRLAFAPPERAGDTELTVSQLRLGARRRTGGGVKFGPVMASATADIPAVDQLTGGKGSVEVGWPAAYLDHGFEGGNGGQVFLQLTTAAPLTFSGKAERSGALVTPDISIKGLSRVVGPIGVDPGDFAVGTLDPMALFSSALGGARLFGVVDLAEIIEDAQSDVAEALAQAPAFLTEALTKAAAFQRDVQSVVEALSAPGLPAAVADARTRAELVLAELAKALEDPLSVDEDALIDAVASLVGSRSAVDTALAATEHGLRRRILGPLDRLVAVGAAAAELVADFLDWARGLESPSSIRTRVVWHPRVKDWGTVVRFADPDRALTLAIDLAPVPGKDQSVDLSCSVEGVTVDLEVVALSIDLIRFSVRSGQKPDVEVQLAEPGGVVFGGPLAFVDDLRSLIPLDGFSDPPSLDIGPDGLQAGFSLALPNLAVGIFSLENLSLSATLDIPFLGESLSFRFAFCTRENPFQLIVSLFGGGGFLGIELTPKGIRTIEASLEFGAAVSMDFAVASGSLSVMAGIYFRYEDPGGVLVSGYFRARGEVDVLGLISASIELTISLTWQEPNKVAGRATLTVEVEVAFFSASVSISCEKRFSGSGSDPTFLQVMGPVGDQDPWADYCRAFAGV